MNKQPIVEFQDFSFQYYSQSEPTLHEINLKIYPGEKILIVGPSGSGKSTLGHCLNGLIPFSYRGEIQGSLKIKGLETKEQNIFNLSKMVGTVLQDADGQFVGLTVGEDIAFAMENDNVPQPEMRDRIEKVAQMVDMQNWLSSSPFELSGGQKQRTSLAGVMIDDVDLLLFDEPLANLDPATGKTAIEIIDDIHRNSQKTIIIIEHRLEDVLHREIDRVIVINDGRIIADMNAHELVSSTILTENGIREPLYVTALKYAGVKVTSDMLPGHISTLKTEFSREALNIWHNAIKADDRQNTNPSILEMKNVSFSYDGIHRILDQVSFDIREGEMVSVVGKNGAGKSTLSKLLCGFEKEDRGSICYKAKDIKDLTIRERAELIGVVMQNPNQMISKSLIYDEVALGLRLRHVAEETIALKVEKVLKICGLSPFIDWPISSLSYGQKKRVTIASILILDPKIIILDEPTAGQDFRHYTEIMEFLVEINKLGVTIILITHDMHLMLEYTPRAIVLAGGRKIADTAASVVLTNTQVIEEANLKETSLFNLAKMAGIEDGTHFVQGFIDYERGLKKPMNMKAKLFSYNSIDTPIHRLSGLTKLICFLFLTFAVMFSYDIRMILGVTVFSLIILKLSRIQFSQIRLMVLYVLVFLITNAVISFFFSPEQGVEIYGTRHNIVRLFGATQLTWEQIFYQITKFFKYASVIPLGIIFLLTTNPSEFASSLNGIGVNYKAAFAVALTLRYFPDIQRDYHDISQAQQARGLDLSHKAKFADRFKNSLLIVIPLIFSSLDRIELISNAMDLRGFSKSKTRTWYTSRKLTRQDYFALSVSALIFIATVLVSVFINHSRFYNPFI